MSELEGSEGLTQPEQSRNEYLRPFTPSTPVAAAVETESPAHVGSFTGAMDFIVPLDTRVLAPLDGIIVKAVDVYERYGPSEEFKDDINFITIRHENGEYSEVGHLAKGSLRVRRGDKVRAGQRIAATGNSGWMTRPHLHFFVFKPEENEDGFIGLTPRFKERKPGLLTKLLGHRKL